MVTRQYILHRGNADIDDFQRLNIAMKAIQGRALHDISKQNREIVTLAVRHV
jgi:hypothetical protein